MGETLEEYCKQLSVAAKASVVAIAEYSPLSRRIEWTYVDHPLNEKHKRMKVSYGMGVAGSVMQTGSPLYCDNIADLPHPLSQYPIVLAEKLQAFAAYPLPSGQMFGAVVLIGYRNKGTLPAKKVVESHVQELINYFREREVTK